MYFSEQKFAVEIGEKGHTDRNQNEESKREAKIENNSDCKFFHQFNPDGGTFDIFLEISKIKYYITQSNEGKIKEQKKQNKRTTTTTTKKKLQNNYEVLCVQHFCVSKTHQIFC